MWQNKFNFYLKSKSWYIVALIILTISVIRGVRFPNNWSYSHFLFNYNYGFIKRGLAGELFQCLNIPYYYSYNFFFIFSISILLLNIVFLALIIKDIVSSNNKLFILSALIFASSLAVVFLSHTVGYFDHIGLLIVLISLRLRGFYKKIIFLLPTLIFAILAHEVIFALFFPVIFMSLLFSFNNEIKRTKLIVLMSFSALLVVLTLFVSGRTIEMRSADKMYDDLQTKTGISLRHEAFGVLSLDSRENINDRKIKWSSPYEIYHLTFSLLSTLPSIMILILFIVQTLKHKRKNIFILLLSILASISPLILNFIASGYAPMECIGNFNKFYHVVYSFFISWTEL